MASGSASASAHTPSPRCNREICNFTNYAKAHVHVVRMKVLVLMWNCGYKVGESLSPLVCT